MLNKFVRYAIVLTLFGLTSCYHILPTVVEEEVSNPNSITHKVADPQVKRARRWISRPIGKFEKQYDLNKNGRLEPEELMRLRMARGYYKKTQKYWKYDKDNNGRFDASEYYDLTHTRNWEEQ